MFGTFTDGLSPGEAFGLVKYADTPANKFPIITRSPQAQVVPAGTTATLSVSAEGPDSLTYQWRLNGSNLHGATKSSYVTPAYRSNPVREYYVEVSNGAGMVASPTARVNFAPVLSSIAILTNSQIRFTITRMYERVSVQVSTDLLSWQTLTNFDPSFDVDYQFTNQITNLNFGFYRAVSLPLG